MQLAEDEEAAEEEILQAEKAKMEAALEATAANAASGVPEQKWVDPTAGQVAWYQLSWWGYLLLAYPTLLFLDDSFHFLPSQNLMELIKSVAPSAPSQ